MAKDNGQYTAIELADWFLKKVNRPAGDTINLMKLQALLYFSEAWSLAVFGRELFAEEVQAWDHGPVVYSVWDRLSLKGWNDLAADDLDSPAELDAETESLLNDVFQAYGEFTNPQLDKMVQKDLPWKDARRGLPPWDLTQRPISKETMAQFYKAAYESDESGFYEQGNAAKEMQKSHLNGQYS